MSSSQHVALAGLFLTSGQSPGPPAQPGVTLILSGQESFQSPQGARSSECPKEDQERAARRLELIVLGSKGARAARHEQSGARTLLPAAGSQQMRGVDGQQLWPSPGS